MKKRSVSLAIYPCGAMVLEVIAETIPDAAPAEQQVLAGATG